MGGGSRPSFGIGAMGLGSFGALIGIGSSSMDALMGLLGKAPNRTGQDRPDTVMGDRRWAIALPGLEPEAMGRRLTVLRGYGPGGYPSNGQSAKRIFVLSSNCLRQQRKRVNADS
jgi:hypothetical protein